MMPSNNREAALEAFRRRANLGPPSAAGIPGGAGAANQITSQNPLAPMAMRSMQPTGGQAPGGQPGGQPAPGGTTKETDPFTTMAIAGIKELGQSAPGETELFLKALIQRLRSLAPSPQGQ